MPKSGTGLKLSERDVTGQVKDFLEAHGWRAIRMQSGLMGRPTGGAFRIGEPGMADWLFLRYGAAAYNERLAEVLWVEIKGRGGRLSPRQSAWHYAERLRGATVVTVGELNGDLNQFRDFDEFREWYSREIGK